MGVKKSGGAAPNWWSDQRKEVAIGYMAVNRSFCMADPPTVTLSIQPQTVQEGERVTFTCLANANPEIKGYR